MTHSLLRHLLLRRPSFVLSLKAAKYAGGAKTHLLHWGIHPGGGFSSQLETWSSLSTMTDRKQQWNVPFKASCPLFLSQILYLRIDLKLSFYSAVAVNRTVLSPQIKTQVSVRRKDYGELYASFLNGNAVSSYARDCVPGPHMTAKLLTSRCLETSVLDNWCLRQLIIYFCNEWILMRNYYGSAVEAARAGKGVLPALLKLYNSSVSQNMA